jgi:hypothetical protein
MEPGSSLPVTADHTLGYHDEQGLALSPSTEPAILPAVDMIAHNHRIVETRGHGFHKIRRCSEVLTFAHASFIPVFR